MQNPKIENFRFHSLKNHAFSWIQRKLAPGWNYQLRPRNRVQVAEIALDTLREVVWILCAVYGRVPWISAKFGLNIFSFCIKSVARQTKIKSAKKVCVEGCTSKLIKKIKTAKMPNARILTFLPSAFPLDSCIDFAFSRFRFFRFSAKFCF